ncbi:MULTISPECIES: sugar phosphate isomerase/epimerase family protein [Halomonas]|uniref:sugar phosphate isomerase/epimerase family protein n=1 Tax=Halomonas TaxID=2745 RepID=UPI001C9571FF|nr:MULTISPECIES: TIM barrel protein [Halomonas]MBY6209806.1 sugar phosphate isomerase/epimerase [Halomonas sp. DP3Y7-2]MBY6230025.1 sugar phosphate isomerase/epimerase [Halomonas sp. DP3Y7-1]MCA0918161.1 sugar phosphate isomerase/epimerase [Halomonas denitrificans]
MHKEISSPNHRRPLSLAALTVLDLSPPEMVETAARAGFDRAGLRLIPATPEELSHPILTDPGLLRATKQRLRETGIQVGDVEILRLTPTTRVKQDVERFIEVAAELGASDILVAGNDDTPDRLIDNFAELCELAAPAGLFPHLEFMPWTAVRNLTEARHIVTQVRRQHANACLLVDAFHFDRSRSTLEQLATVPPDWMRYAQLCDVPGPVPECMQDILRQAREERAFPGEGQANLSGLLRQLADDLPLSIEVPTPALQRQGVSALERARRAHDTAMAVLARTQGQSEET